MVRAFCQSASAARLALHDGADSCVWLTAFGTTFSTGNASSSRHPSVFLPLPASVLRYSIFGRPSTSVPSERSRAARASADLLRFAWGGVKLYVTQGRTPRE